MEDTGQSPATTETIVEKVEHLIEEVRDEVDHLIHPDAAKFTAAREILDAAPVPIEGRLIPGVNVDAPPAAEHTPTRAEAREMFKENPGLWSVVTDEGPMTRDEC